MTRIPLARLAGDAQGFTSLQTERLLELNRTLSTGLEVERPSDDPGAFARIRALKAEIVDIEQFERNQAASLRMLRQMEAAITTAQDRVARLRALALQGANDTYTTADMRMLSIEVAEIIEDLISIGNVRSEDRAVFGGSQIRGDPFLATRDKRGNVTGVTYGGDLVELQAEVEKGAFVGSSLPGARVFGAGGQVLRSTLTAWDGTNPSEHADRELTAAFLPSSGIVDGSFVVNGVRIRYDIDGDPTSGEGDSLLDIARAVNEAPTGVAASVTGTLVGSDGAVPPAPLTTADPTAALSGTFGAGVAGTFTLNGETITVTAFDTLATLRDKINATTSRTGVTAEILDASGTVVDEVFNPAAGPFTFRLQGGVEIADTGAGASTVMRVGAGLGFTNGAASPGNLVGIVTEAYRLRLEGRSAGEISLRDDNGSLLRDLGFITGNDPALGNFNPAAVVSQGTIFSAALSLRDALQNGDTVTIRDSLIETVDLGLQALESARVEIGVRENRIERAETRGAEFKQNARDLVSRLEEADLSEVITDLRQQMTVQQAALRAIAETLRLSLLNFL